MSDSSSSVARILCPEAKLLFLSAGGSRNDAEMSRLLREGVDWRKLEWLVDRERAASILWSRIQGLPDLVLPDREWPGLQHRAMVAEFRQQVLAERLMAVLDMLNRAGIEPLLLKGTALARTVYSSVTERPMADLDILVLPEQATEARAVLLRSGWLWHANHFPDHFYHRHHHLPPLQDAQGTGLWLEIHTDLFIQGHPFRLTADVVRKRSQAISVDGRIARVPDPVDQLLYATLHFAWSHLLEKGAWTAFRDVEAFSTWPWTDWEALSRRAQEVGGEHYCYWSLRLARALAGVQVPDEVLQRLKPALPEFLLRALSRHYALQLVPSEHACPSVALSRALWSAGTHALRRRPASAAPWAEHDTFAPLRRGTHTAEPYRLSAALRYRRVRAWTAYVSELLGVATVR